MSARTMVVSFSVVAAGVALVQPAAPPPEPAPRDVAPLEPLERCVAAPALALLAAELPQDGVREPVHAVDWTPADGLWLDPRLTRAYRHLARCDRSGPLTSATTMASFRLATASIREAGKVRHEEGAGAAADVLVEAWAANLHQGHAGDLVSVMVSYGVELQVLDELTLLAPELSATDAAAVRDRVRRLGALRPTPSAAGDLAATAHYPGWPGWWVAAGCRRTVGPRVERIDEAFARGDREALDAIAAEGRRGWRGWDPGVGCLSGLTSVLGDALDELERLEERHAALEAALSPTVTVRPMP